MKPEYRILRGRIERFVIHYHGPQFHAIVCDPPYELGFMGKDWDKSGIAFQPEIWAGLKELMLPGAFGMAFASARGWHRLAVAIEDAGFRIHPSIFGFLYGSGFPKATRIDTQIQPKREQTVIGRRKHPTLKDTSRLEEQANAAHGHNKWAREWDIHEPTDPLAKTWAGYRYGLQALKPALEPIVVFQRPYEGKPVNSIIKTGAGAFNIDGARIPTSDVWNGAMHDSGPSIVLSGGADGSLNNMRSPAHPKGRWPANFYLDEEAARRLGEQSGMKKAGIAVRHRSGGNTCHSSKPKPPMKDMGYGDTGTAARFFLNVDWKLEHSDPVLYCPKASRKERDAGLEEVTRTIPHAAYGDFKGTPEHAPNTMGRQRNPHPTLKPIKLTQWLSSLLLPPEEYAPRRILVPFAGSGSEMIGAILAGWDIVIGVEMEKEYVEIAKARLKYWAQKNQPRLF